MRTSTAMRVLTRMRAPTGLMGTATTINTDGFLSLLMLSAPGESVSRSFSSAALHQQYYNNNNNDDNNNNNPHSGPTGSLFTDNIPVGPGLLGATASIQRTFGPRSNAEGLLAVGGAALAARSSFDPNYARAQEWIRHHAVGPARLSPVLLAGLTGALTEAAFPHAIMVGHTVRHHRPLIVGVTVTASIQVTAVQPATTRPVLRDDDDDEDNDSNQNHHEEHERTAGANAERKWGYNVTLKTAVTRVRDDAVIAQGTNELWVPDYLTM